MSKEFNKSKFGFNGFKKHDNQQHNEERRIFDIQEKKMPQEQQELPKLDEKVEEKKQENIDKANSIYLNEGSSIYNKHGVVSVHSKLNVRLNPDRNSEIVEVINTGDMIRFRDSKKIDWYEVETKSGKHGYCMCEYIREV